MGIQAPKKMESPLNLILPFKGNKASAQQSLFLARMDRYENELHALGQEVIQLLSDSHPEDFELSINKKSVGQVLQYFWRFSTRSRDRKYHRLHSEPVIQYLAERNIHVQQKESLIAMESDLVGVNCNLRLVHTFRSVLSYQRESREAVQDVWARW